jgi:hypothetical protein
MASELEYIEAIIRVEIKTHKKHDLELVQKIATTSGSLGNRARAALKKL